MKESRGMANIDPTKINDCPQTKNILIDFFDYHQKGDHEKVKESLNLKDAHTPTHSFSQGVTYSFEDRDGINRKIQFTSSILTFRSKREAEKPAYELFRAIIFDNAATVGEGAYGKVLNVRGTLYGYPSDLFYKPKDEKKSRVVKYEESRMQKDTVDLSAYPESKMLRLLVDYHSKDLIYELDYTTRIVRSWIIMKKIPNMPLNKFIESDVYSKLTEFNQAKIIQKLLVALYLLHFYMKHGDIKTHNTMVDTKNDFAISYIDLGTASINDFQKACGTPGYMSPEMMDRLANPWARDILSDPADVYSLGVTIARFLGLDWSRKMDRVRKIFAANPSPALFAESIRRRILPTVANPGVYPVSFKNKINPYFELMIKNMLAWDPEKRASLKDAISHMDVYLGSHDPYFVPFSFEAPSVISDESAAAPQCRAFSAAAGKAEAEPDQAPVASPVKFIYFPANLSNTLEKGSTPYDAFCHYPPLERTHIFYPHVFIKFSSKYPEKSGVIKYAVVNPRNLIAKSNAAVYGVTGTLTLVDGRWQFKLKIGDKARVMKEIEITATGLDADETMKRLDENMGRFGYLRHKRPTCNGGKSRVYVIFKRIPGTDVSRFLERNPYHAGLYLQRLRIAWNIANELYEAFHKRSLLHHDVKSENIIINWKTLAARFVDVDLMSPDIFAHIRGTPHYNSPSKIENQFLENTRPITPEDDMHSLGIVLGELFGVWFTRSDHYQRQGHQRYLYLLSRCYTAPLDLASVENKAIRFLLSEMLVYKKDQCLQLPNLIQRLGEMIEDAQRLSEARSERREEKCADLLSRQLAEQTGILPYLSFPIKAKDTVVDLRDDSSEPIPSEKYNSVFELPAYNRKKLFPETIQLQDNNYLRVWARYISDVAANYMDFSPLRANILVAVSNYIHAKTITITSRLFPFFEPILMDRLDKIKKFIEVAVDTTIDDIKIRANLEYLYTTIQTGVLGRSALREGVRSAVEEASVASPSPPAGRAHSKQGG